MGFRRSAVVLATAAAALVSAPAAGAAPPMSVELGHVHCNDLSWLKPMVPMLDDQVDEKLDEVANIPVTIRGTENGDNAPFTITADGDRKAKGSVGPGGVVINGISVPDHGDVRIEVRSHGTVLLDRTVTVSCHDEQKPPEKRPAPDTRPIERPPQPNEQPWWPFGGDSGSITDLLPPFLR
ncbi:hypothetical protein FHX42_004678 [Saccharopolyspora lacisalsi]|uniref:Uncharacterized protein n=1 Tax=Halosaccharopolyspora lacisalsi TaxID=1000566 RepID=A0A839E0M2_9PSEU|nr:hypothetical protein [Halosaccharopolyspora lacisalsi]MBA8827294.1 hypothetical protein [Halosaccharopolyspora lacisalsi]